MTTTLVLVPGLLCTREVYAPQIEALADAVDIVVADHTRQSAMPAIAAAILEELPERFVLAGLSMGGYVALEIMRQQPERVQALALIDTNARADTPEQTEFRRTQIAQARREGIAPVIEQLIPRFVDESRHGEKDLLDTVRRMAADTGVDVFERQQNAIIGRVDSRPSLERISCPSVVIVGDRDKSSLPELSEEMAAGIPGAKLEVIAECGHLSTLERPAEVNAVLKRLLAEV